MSHFVRASKYRHVFCEPPKPETTYSGFTLSTATGEQSYVKANTKFFAVAVQGGGGPFAVVPFERTGRAASEVPLINGHTAQVLDFDFNPFHENVIASAADDTTIKVWGIPEGGPTETITTPLVDLRGHQRKVALLRFHPTASNLLASVGGDFLVKLWDIEHGAEVSTNTTHSEIIQDIVWDYRGNVYATSTKDKAVRFFDARTNVLAQEIPEAHDGSKSAKLTFLGPKEKLVSVGFTRQSQRQLKVWDPRNLAAPIKRIDIDQAAGVILPFYDPDSCLLFLAGKGDGNIRYYELVDEDPWCFPISEYRSSSSAKGATFVPKRALDVGRNETARILKVTTNTVEALSFIVPRKGDAFQEDLFPPTYAGQPSHTLHEFLGGSNQPPRTVSLAPGAHPTSVAAPAHATTPVAAPKSAAQLSRELDAANARIQALEKRLRDAGLNAN